LTNRVLFEEHAFVGFARRYDINLVSSNTIIKDVCPEKTAVLYPSGTLTLIPTAVPLALPHETSNVADLALATTSFGLNLLSFKSATWKQSTISVTTAAVAAVIAAGGIIILLPTHPPWAASTPVAGWLGSHLCMWHISVAQ
jgi:hypothetical protein